MTELKKEFPIKLICQTLEIARSTYYYQKDPDYLKKYQPIKKKIEKIIAKHPKYGYRRIKDELRNRGIQVNAKVLRKLLNLWDLKLLRKMKKPKPSGIESILREAGDKANLVKQLSPPILPFRVIYTDFTEIRCLAGIFKFIPFLDHCTKRITGWNVAKSANRESALTAWSLTRRYFKRMRLPLSGVIVHSDQGKPFVSYLYVGKLLKSGIRLSYATHGAKDNPLMESGIGRFKEEYRDEFSQAQSFAELKSILKSKVRDWNGSRIHSALKGRSPDEFIKNIIPFTNSLKS